MTLAANATVSAGLLRCSSSSSGSRAARPTRLRCTAAYAPGLGSSAPNGASSAHRHRSNELTVSSGGPLSVLLSGAGGAAVAAAIEGAAKSGAAPSITINVYAADPAAAVAPPGEAVPVKAVLSPPEVYAACAKMGAYKASQPAWKNLMLAVAAGCYTAMFGALLLMVGPNCGGLAASNPGLARYITGAIGLPFQLMVIMVCGAELFTGSTAMVTAAYYEGKVSLRQLGRQWAGSYAGNALGCALGVALLLGSGVVKGLMPGVSAISLAKISYPLHQTFIKAVLANWFVCLAVWQATAAQTAGGKFISILGPLSAFIAIGFEHCIANMVFVPLGILMGVPGVTWEAFLFKNLIPVTLGNIFAGAVCVATLYSMAYGQLGKRVQRSLDLAELLRLRRAGLRYSR
ncbi:hypothetical protein COHA_005880 [Chlorella ohadii]|uniref:Uncharacterized protein n=1 Tax=Chlorella ohadii TaxID=2649997 RepID=A0AAD5H502_9CHLO|nr:hypothetical protein COHA_005880 [Chlorella ohadii]